MRYELTLPNTGMGFAEHAVAAGQELGVCTTGFFVPDDRRNFYSKIESFHDLLGPYFAEGRTPASIHHFLALIENNHAKVYVNDLSIIMRMVSRRAIKAGEPVSNKEIGGISAVRFEGIELPPTSVVVFYFTLGWRRGLFFDFGPLHDRPLREMHRVIGACYDWLFFSDLYAIANDYWPIIFDAGWFPFMRITGGTFENITAFLDRAILPAWEEIVFSQFGESQLRDLVESWHVVDAFREHIPFAERAVERYAAGDYLSAISNLWPRIEGALRYLYTGSETKPGKNALLANVRDMLEKKATAPNSYLPGLFEAYLLRYYFRDFNLKEDRIDLGRHSHAHGVTKAETYSHARALQGFLILDQLACYAKLGSTERDNSAAGAASSATSDATPHSEDQKSS
jgi:hypothetical protein